MMRCYDKQPIKFKPTPLKPTRGRFGRKKQYRVGEATASAVNRYLHVYMSSTDVAFEWVWHLSGHGIQVGVVH